jgi:hypothetical protein
MSDTKTYSNRSNAQRAAKAELGADAIAGVDFHVYEASKGQFAWKRGKAPEGNPAASKAGKPAKAPKAAKEPKAPREEKAKPLGKRAATEAAAADGKLPAPPDFTAATHARYRGKLAEVVAMAEAGDIKGLKAYQLNPISTSPKAIDRYRNLSITALKAREARGA